MGKITGYGSDTGPTADDLIVTVDMTSGANKKVALGSLRALFATKRVTSITSGSSPTPNWDTTDIYVITNLGGTAGTSITATFGAPSGTPSDGQSIVIRVKDNGTAQNLAYNASFRGVGVTPPTTTTPGKVLYLGCVWNAQDGTVDIIAVARLA